MGYRSMHIAQVALVLNFWWGNSKSEKSQYKIDWYAIDHLQHEKRAEIGFDSFC